MPLNEFLSETMAILRNEPAATEIIVERCKPLRFAAESGNFHAAFEGLDRAMG